MKEIVLMVQTMEQQYTRVSDRFPSNADPDPGFIKMNAYSDPRLNFFR
jgi:hypothetical protein